MFYVTRFLTWSRAVLAAMLGALTARPAAALLATANIHLFSNVHTPTSLDDVADYTEQVGTGYALVALGTPGAAINAGDNTTAATQTAAFTVTGTSIAWPPVTGYFITDTTNAIFYGAELFDAPIPMAFIGDSLVLNLLLPLHNTVQVN